jgi:hypothetical protein
MWRDLKRMIFWGLVIAAAVLVATTAAGDHESDYGALTLPPGGKVELPEGTVKIFYDEGGQSRGGRNLEAPLRFQVVPAGGGEPLTSEATSTSATGTGTQRSEDVISRGSVAKLDVPSEGVYVVTGGNGVAPGEIKFGTDPFSAVLKRWRLIGGLLIAAVIIALIPAPHTRRSSNSAAWA